MAKVSGGTIYTYRTLQRFYVFNEKTGDQLGIFNSIIEAQKCCKENSVSIHATNDPNYPYKMYQLRMQNNDANS